MIAFRQITVHCTTESNIFRGITIANKRLIKDCTKDMTTFVAKLRQIRIPSQRS